MSDVNLDDIRWNAVETRNLVINKCAILPPLAVAKLCEDIQTLVAEVERLTKERDEWNERALKYYRVALREMDRWSSEDEEEHQLAIAELHHE